MLAPKKLWTMVGVQDRQRWKTVRGHVHAIVVCRRVFCIVLFEDFQWHRFEIKRNARKEARRIGTSKKLYPEGEWKSGERERDCDLSQILSVAWRCGSVHYRSLLPFFSSALQFGSAVRRSCDPGERLRLFEVRKVIENKQGVQQEDYLQSELDRPEELLNAVAECAGRVRWPSANQCARERWPLFAIRLWSLQSSQSRGSRGNVAKEMTRASRPARRHSLLRQ